MAVGFTGGSGGGSGFVVVTTGLGFTGGCGGNAGGGCFGGFVCATVLLALAIGRFGAGADPLGETRGSGEVLVELPFEAATITPGLSLGFSTVPAPTVPPSRVRRVTT